MSSGYLLGHLIPRREVQAPPQSYFSAFLPLPSPDLHSGATGEVGGTKLRGWGEQRRPLLLSGFTLLRWMFLNSPFPQGLGEKGGVWMNILASTLLTFPLCPVSSPDPLSRRSQTRRVGLQDFSFQYILLSSYPRDTLHSPDTLHIIKESSPESCTHVSLHV